MVIAIASGTRFYYRKYARVKPSLLLNAVHELAKVQKWVQEIDKVIKRKPSIASRIAK